MTFSINEKYLSDAEKKIGAIFPHFYVNRIKMENGGYIKISSESWKLFPIFDSSEKKRLKRTSNDVLVETKNAREWKDFPTNAIAIGGNDYGDLLILIIDVKTNKMENAIFLWSHETGNVEKLSVNNLL